MAQDLIDRAVSNLKGQHGLPTADVKPEVAASSPAASARPQEPIGTPAQQAADAARIAAEIANRSAETGVDPNTELLAKKDKAIADGHEKIEKLEQMHQNLVSQTQQLLEKMGSAEEAQKVQSLELPGLPDNYDELSAEEQLKTQRETIEKFRTEVTNVLQQKDDALKNFLSPLAREVGEMVKDRDRDSVLRAYPKFDWKQHEPEIAKYREELGWGPSAVEAAAVVAARHNPSMLLQPEPQVPAVESSRPSMQTASGGRPNATPKADRAEVDAGLTRAILEAHRSNNGLRARELSQALLKNRLFGSR